MCRLGDFLRAREAVLGLVLVGCAVNPPPNPLPTPQPTPKPTPTPWIPPVHEVVCPASLDRINLKVRDQAAWIVDATPKTCDREFCARVFPGNLCCDMGLEGGSDRPFCEQLFGPYEWSFGGIPCPTEACFSNGNPLQQRILKRAGSGVVSVKAANGVIGSGVIP